MYVSVDDIVLSDENYFIDSRTLVFNVAPAKGAIIRIYRETSTQRLVSWADASVLKAADMTISQVQQNHLIEEAQDWSRINSVVLEGAESDDPKWNMQYHRIVNVADPLEDGDAVTKGYMEDVQGGFVQANTALKDEATRQAANASASASTAKGAETNAKNSETQADNSASLAQKWAEGTPPSGKSSKAWATEAANSASAASTSAGNAKTSETNAASSASSASSSASTATSKASAASTSASAAKTSETNAKNSETNAGKSASAAAGSASTAKTEADRATYYPMANLIGKTPNYYKRPGLFTLNKTTITIPKNTQVNIGDKGYISTADVTLQLSTAGTAANRAGKDVYLYACQPSDANSTVPVFVVSLNSTVPSGYTASNSRKIGGFHCLCVAAGTISGHNASGYVAGDAIPISAWDLLHRAASNNEGMVWVEEIRQWVDIYLSGVESGVLVSKYGAVIADGASSTKYNGELFVEKLALVKKRPLWRNEFMVVAKGSNEGTNIANSADPNTTGGHKDTAGRRMISNYFLEDCCGVLYQWLADTFEFYPGATWSTANFYLSGYSWQEKSVYNPDIDTMKYGSCGGLLRRGLAGGNWDLGSSCGSRYVACYNFSSDGWSRFGCRGACEPRVVNL